MRFIFCIGTALIASSSLVHANPCPLEKAAGIREANAYVPVEWDALTAATAVDGWLASPGVARAVFEYWKKTGAVRDGRHAPEARFMRLPPNLSVEETGRGVFAEFVRLNEGKNLPPTIDHPRERTLTDAARIGYLADLARAGQEVSRVPGPKVPPKLAKALLPVREKLARHRWLDQVWKVHQLERAVYRGPKDGSDVSPTAAAWLRDEHLPFLRSNAFAWAARTVLERITHPDLEIGNLADGFLISVDSRKPGALVVAAFVEAFRSLGAPQAAWAKLRKSELLKARMLADLLMANPELRLRLANEIDALGVSWLARNEHTRREMRATTQFIGLTAWMAWPMFGAAAAVASLADPLSGVVAGSVGLAAPLVPAIMRMALGYRAKKLTALGASGNFHPQALPVRELPVPALPALATEPKPAEKPVAYVSAVDSLAANASPSALAMASDAVTQALMNRSLRLAAPAFTRDFEHALARLPDDLTYCAACSELLAPIREMSESLRQIEADFDRIQRDLVDLDVRFTEATNRIEQVPAEKRTAAQQRDLKALDAERLALSTTRAALESDRTRLEAFLDLLVSAPPLLKGVSADGSQPLVADVKALIATLRRGPREGMAP